jgi:hypothetical protein
MTMKIDDLIIQMATTFKNSGGNMQWAPAAIVMSMNEDEMKVLAEEAIRARLQTASMLSETL